MTAHDKHMKGPSQSGWGLVVSVESGGVEYPYGA